MRLSKVKLESFRMFNDLEVSIPDSKCVLFIGVNGSGKSTVLDAIALLLAQFTGAISSRGSKYFAEYGLSDSDINIESDSCRLRLNIDFDLEDYGGSLSPLKINLYKERGDRKFSYDFMPKEILNRIKGPLEVDGNQGDHIISLPIICYYRANRSVINADNRRKRRAYYNPRLLAYENTLIETRSSFSMFQEWFVNEENLENQQKVHLNDLSYRLPSLEVVRQGIERFLDSLDSSGIQNLRVLREGGKYTNISDRQTDAESYLVITKDNQDIRLDRMSAGERNVIYLVADIARRLFLANQNANSLSGTGIVMVDELELHLHPAWQRQIIPSLQKTFPNIQFLFSTHSPQILSRVTHDSVIVLDNKEVFSVGSSPFGRDTNGILEEIMGVDKRPREIDDLVDKILSELSKDSHSIDFQSVDSDMKRLRIMVAPSDPVLLRIENITRRKKMLA
ncbi:MAG: AAA family ATPase [Cyanobacteria bacterium J06649_11]